MTRRVAPKSALVSLFDASISPVYALDNDGLIVFCNQALAAWTGIAADDLVGRQVVYHSADDPRSLPGIAAGLCPPPVAMKGRACDGHVSCPTRHGHLVYRRGHFEPLASADWGKNPSGILAILAAEDLTLEEVAAQYTPDADSDVLHATIRRYRRHQAENYDLALLIGESVAMQTIRRQIVMAAATTAPVTIVGLPGSGRDHIARAIHYYPPHDAQRKLITHDGLMLDVEELQWSLETLLDRGRSSGKFNTLLIRDVHRASQPVQQQLLAALTSKHGSLKVIVTMAGNPHHLADEETLGADFVAALTALVIEVPPLVSRRGDLPLLAQFFVEECNRDHTRQISGLAQDAVELLALYSWPRGIRELREVIHAAHAVTTQTVITAADLPAVIHHAAADVSLPKREDESVNLDQLLARIERELIERAIGRAHGNKTQAAESLGISRPRFYRRLVQLGLENLGNTR
ncbi:MAG: sigma 54-interacting transcriptional regulator [Pirellulales bacterium]|nr:sigma 54-interacting transcriptional regulator [Pirellulales bacterium]